MIIKVSCQDPHGTSYLEYPPCVVKPIIVRYTSTDRGGGRVVHMISGIPLGLEYSTVFGPVPYENHYETTIYAFSPWLLQSLVHSASLPQTLNPAS